MVEPDYPVVPLPNPGEGGPLPPFPGEDICPPVPGPGGSTSNSGSWFPNGWFPGQFFPREASVRFLNAAYGYPAFNITVEKTRRARKLGYSSLSDYERVYSGYRTVTVMGADGYVYIQKSLPFQASSVTTVAVVNRPGGLDLLQISDQCCKPTGPYSNLRVSNLAYSSKPMDMLLADGRTVFADINFKETTSYKRIRPGAYEFLFADTRQEPMPYYMDIETLDSDFLGQYPVPNMEAFLYLDVKREKNYTIFLLKSEAASGIMAIAAEGK